MSSAELDIVMLTKALRQMALVEEEELTQSQIQTIMCIAYGVRLAQKNERCDNVNLYLPRQPGTSELPFLL